MCSVRRRFFCPLGGPTELHSLSPNLFNHCCAVSRLRKRRRVREVSHLPAAHGLFPTPAGKPAVASGNSRFWVGEAKRRFYVHRCESQSVWGDGRPGGVIFGAKPIGCTAAARDYSLSLTTYRNPLEVPPRGFESPSRPGSMTYLSRPRGGGGGGGVLQKKIPSPQRGNYGKPRGSVRF